MQTLLFPFKFYMYAAPYSMNQYFYALNPTSWELAVALYTVSVKSSALTAGGEDVWPKVSWAKRSFCKSAGLGPFDVPLGTFCINTDTSHGGGWHTPIAAVLAAVPVSLHPPSPERSPPQQSAIPFTLCVALITGSLGSQKCFPTESWLFQSYSYSEICLSQNNTHLQTYMGKDGCLCEKKSLQCEWVWVWFSTVSIYWRKKLNETTVKWQWWVHGGALRISFCIQSFIRQKGEIKEALDTLKHVI